MQVALVAASKGVKIQDIRNIQIEKILNCHWFEARETFCRVVKNLGKYKEFDIQMYIVYINTDEEGARFLFEVIRYQQPGVG